MLKKCAKVLAPLAAILMVWFMAGCPALLDPELGDLKGGPRETVENPPAVPEIPEIIIYGVRTGGFTAEGGLPGITVADAVAGTIFLGEEATAEDATDLEFTYSQLDGYDLAVDYGVTPVSSDDPLEWQPEALIEGVFESGSYLVIKVTDNSLDPADSNYVTYYKYLIAWGQNGAGIESITIGGRTFLITGAPYLGAEPNGTAGISNTMVYLTNAQIAAGRAITVGLRPDSQKAVVTWGPTWPANDTMPDEEFVDSPINAILANNSRIFIRVQSMNGDFWGNYIVQVSYANNAVLGTFTAARASTTTLGTPQGSWNAEDLIDGEPIAVKSTRLLDTAAAHTGGTNPGVVSWAFTSDLETEPDFVALAELQDLTFGGYIYVRTAYNDNFINIYRFPVTQKPLSDDATLNSIRIGDRNMNLGTPGYPVEQAVAGAEVAVNINQFSQIAIGWADADADTVIAYGLLKGGTGTATYTPAIPDNIADGDILVIRVTSEDANSILFYKVPVKRLFSSDATLQSILFGISVAARGDPGATADATVAGSADLYQDWTAASTITLRKDAYSTVRYALTTSESGSPAWSASQPAAASVVPNTWVWFEVTAEDGTKLYYKIKIESVKVTVYGRGVPDPEFVAKYPYMVFPDLGPNELLTDSIGTDGMATKLPNATYWNSVATPAGPGNMHTYMDPFHFANGNRVTNIADWENRRKELRMIAGYYQKGFMPSLESDLVDVWLSGTNNTTINLRHRPSGRTLTANAGVTANASATVSGREGKLGITGGVTASNNWSMSATVPNVANADIQSFYGITGSSVITRDSAGPWNRSLLLIAIEGTSDPTTAGGARQAVEQYYYPVPAGTHPYNEGGNGSWFTTKGPLSTTGVSTNGKQAMHFIVLAHGRKPGTRAGFARIGDSGSHGHVSNSFLYEAGLRLDVSAQESLRLSGFSETYISQALAGLPDNSAGLPARAGHAATMFGAERTPGFYNVNPDGTLKMGQYAVRREAITVRGPQPYGWAVSLTPENHQGFSKRTTAGSNGGMDDTWGVPWYLVGIRGANETADMNYGTGTDVVNAGDRGAEVVVVREMFNGKATGMPSYGTAAQSNQVVRRFRHARGWSPYFEAFNAVPHSNQNTGVQFPLPVGRDNTEVPYTAWYSDMDASYQAGISSWIEDASLNVWSNSVFATFPANHQVDDFDYPGDTGGFQTNIPTETYYQAMLDAPYGVQVHSYPAMQGRTNDYASFVTWVVVDEIYKMYGEAEGNGQPATGEDVPANSGLYDGWDKYLYNNMQDIWWGNHADMQGAAQPSMTDARTRLLQRGDGVSTTIAEAKADIRIARFRDPSFLVDDPHAYIMDWHKMHISRPHPDGAPGTPISERISRRVTPLLADFFKGEIYHNAPAKYSATVSARTYHDAAKAAIAGDQLKFTGPKYKPMDWRGLVDTPEAE
jgi:hypothetical protein